MLAMTAVRKGRRAGRDCPGPGSARLRWAGLSGHDLRVSPLALPVEGVNSVAARERGLTCCGIYPS